MTDDDVVPFPARRAIQQHLWNEYIQPGDNEWTTWTDSILLAEAAAAALRQAGWQVIPQSGYSLDDVENIRRAYQPSDTDGATA